VSEVMIEEADDLELRWPKANDRIFVEAPSFQGAWTAKRTDERLYRMIKGFHEAGDLLVDESLTNPHRARDLLYPAIFSYRHGIELQLKYLLMAYGPLAGEAPNFRSHGLRELWVACRRLIMRLEGKEEPSDKEAFDAVDAQIAEFDSVDSGSDAFRFAHDKRGGAIKLPINEIDLSNLRAVVASLRNFLECVDCYLHYGCGIPHCAH